MAGPQVVLHSTRLPHRCKATSQSGNYTHAHISISEFQRQPSSFKLLLLYTRLIHTRLFSLRIKHIRDGRLGSFVVGGSSSRLRFWHCRWWDWIRSPTHISPTRSPYSRRAIQECHCEPNELEKGAERAPSTSPGTEYPKQSHALAQHIQGIPENTPSPVSLCSISWLPSQRPDSKFGAHYFYSDGTVPTGDHIYRFVHTVSHTLKSRYIDKERPSVITIKGGIAVLDKVLKEIYPDFEITKSKCLQIDSLLNKLVQDKVLTAGRWRPSGRVGFRTLLVLADTWVNTGLADGVRSWDTYISRLLGIVLISSLSARSGDVLRTQIYEGMECCLFRDLAVSFQGGDDTEHLIMNVCLRFVKGYK